MNSYRELKSIISRGQVILFVGAGVSATLGLPNWADLVAHLADELGYDSRLFNTYGDYLSLAEYYIIKKGHLGELRHWMDINWNVSDESIKESKVYDYIVDLGFPIIYTTNYDHCLERAFQLRNKSFKRIVDVDDFVDINPNDTQIIKFHGDTISDSTIVLSERSYFERLEFESPLDIKLKSDILGKSILFLGYSLSDINIRLLLYKIDKIWKNSRYGNNRPKSFIFLPKPNPIQETIFENRGIKTIIGNSIDREKSIEDFLRELNNS